MKIGVYDSGLGGLTVLFQLKKVMPWHEYVFLGDNARVPYGDKSLDQLKAYTKESLEFLYHEKGCDAVVVACNTLSANTLEYARELGYKQLYGVLVPTAEHAVQHTKGSIGVIATRATIASAAFEQVIAGINAGIQVTSKATPLLTPLIEEARAGKPETNIILKNYLRSFKDANIDTLILGCTHYPVLERDIKRIMGKHVRVVSSPHPVAVQMLEQWAGSTDTNSVGKTEYIVTGDVERFKEQVKSVFGKGLQVVRFHKLISKT